MPLIQRIFAADKIRKGIAKLIEDMSSGIPNTRETHNRGFPV